MDATPEQPPESRAAGSQPEKPERLSLPTSTGVSRSARPRTDVSPSAPAASIRPAWSFLTR